MAADKKFILHLKAFLLSHQIGSDPNKNLAKIKVIANTNPDRWDGKLPTQGIVPDAGFCRFLEARARQPLAPWAWYEKEHEPVPKVVRDIYERLSFDFALHFPPQHAWIYVKAEPRPAEFQLLGQQEHLKAFILISLINEKMEPSRRDHKRLRLANVMGSSDLDRIFAFIAFAEEDKRYQKVPDNVPRITRLVHPSSNTANWNIRLPGDNRIYGSFQEIIAPR